MSNRPSKLIEEYLAAFAWANKLSPPPSITYENGWYVFGGKGHAGFRYRRKKLEAMRDTLRTYGRHSDALAKET